VDVFTVLFVFLKAILIFVTKLSGKLQKQRKNTKKLKLMLDNLDFSDILFAETASTSEEKQGVPLMLGSPEMPQHLILAMDHHQLLVEEAKRRRLLAEIHGATAYPQQRWRRLRFRVGELLVYMGQRLKADAVWG
jgi:hypothetical protein